MKRLFIQALFCILFFVLIGCNNTSTEEGYEKSTSDKNSDSTSIKVESLIEERKNYLQNRDFDGDRMNKMKRQIDDLYEPELVNKLINLEDPILQMIELLRAKLGKGE